MDDRAARLAALLDYGFQDRALLEAALVHPSAREGRQPSDYQRLEFLGDRVIALVVADLLYRRFPQESEGELARRLAALVRREAIAGVADRLELGQALVLARSEDSASGRRNPTTLADACEAVIGAVYADGGFESAAILVRRLWAPLLDGQGAAPRDAKTALQEWAQARGRGLPVYAVASVEGPAHEPAFRVSVAVAGESPEQGGGRSKREAEQAAAAALLARLDG